MFVPDRVSMVVTEEVVNVDKSTVVIRVTKGDPNAIIAVGRVRVPGLVRVLDLVLVRVLVRVLDLVPVRVPGLVRVHVKDLVSDLRGQDGEKSVQIANKD